MNTRSIPRRALGALAALTIIGCSPKAPSTTYDAMSALPASLNSAEPLINAVGTAVPGMTQGQQIAGLGSLFALGKANMPADQYQQLSSAVPGADALAAEALGMGLKNVKGLKDVNNFLAKSGVTPAQTGQMITALGQVMGARVSPQAATSFFNALR